MPPCDNAPGCHRRWSGVLAPMALLLVAAADTATSERRSPADRTRAWPPSMRREIRRRLAAEHPYESRAADRSGGSLLRRVRSVPSKPDEGALRRAVDLRNAAGKVPPKNSGGGPLTRPGPTGSGGVPRSRCRCGHGVTVLRFFFDHPVCSVTGQQSTERSPWTGHMDPPPATSAGITLVGVRLPSRYRERPGSEPLAKQRAVVKGLGGCERGRGGRR